MTDSQLTFSSHLDNVENICAISPITKLNWDIALQASVEVWVYRSDLLHEKYGGNKYFKLLHHLKAFEQSNSRILLSFGGAYSNHIYALAAVGQSLNIPTVGVIRGERPNILSPTLQDAKSMGMRLHFVGRKIYAQKNSEALKQSLIELFGQVYLIPEGGDNELGSLGCKEWAMALEKLAPKKLDAVCMAVGTGGTISGFCASQWPTQFHGYVVLKGSDEDYQAMRQKIIQRSNNLVSSGGAGSKQKGSVLNLTLHTDVHCGGYAKLSPELRHFISEFERETSVPLDPVYTAKVMFGIYQQIKKKYWPKGSKLLFIHTGGIQGKRGFS